MTKVVIFSMPNIYQTWSKSQIVGPWLGGLSIAGNCPNHEVYVADLVLRRDNVLKGVDDAIKEINPRRVGLSTMTFPYPTAVRVGLKIKEKYGLEVALGGYHATAMREQIAEEASDSFDFIFAGEAERTFNEFSDNKPFEQISGFSYKDKYGKWVHNPRHTSLSISHGIDSIALPKRDARIWKKGFHFHNRILDTAEDARGCNKHCKFCSIRNMLPGSRYQQFHQERTLEDLYIARKMGAESIFFTGDNPAANPEQFRILLNSIIDRGLSDMNYGGMVSTKSMTDPSLVALMRKAGWDFVFLGVENISKQNLKYMGKASSEKLAGEAIKVLRNSGMTILAGMIVGNPDDTKETIEENFDWLIENKPDAVLPQFATPYPETLMRKELMDEGLIINKGGLGEIGGNEDWSTYNGEFAHCMTRSGLMPEDIEEIVYGEHERFNRKRLMRLPSLNLARNNPWHIFMTAVHEGPKQILRAVNERNLSLREKSQRERQRKIDMNKFNI